MSTVTLEIENKKMLVPKLRFQGFEENWELKKLIDFAPLQRGFDLPVINIKQGKYPVVFSNGILKTHDEFKAKAPGVVTGRSGTIGKVTFVEEDYWPHNTALWVTDFKNNDAKFVYFFYSNFKLERLGTGSSVPTLNRNDVHAKKTFFPTLLEQQKIASFLSAVDEKIQQLSRKKELLEQYKKGVMQQLFSGKLRFKDENGEDYPDWEEKKLGDITESIKSGKSTSMENGMFPLYGSTGIIGKCAEYSHNGMYILIARVGANAGTINLINDQFGVSDNTLVLNCNQNSFVNYLFHYLDFYNLNRLVFGSGQPLITGGQLKVLKLNLPSQPEQQKIANFLSSIDTKIENVNKQITQTQTFKKGLLQGMFV
jgi:type I restriction enzyme S subunit